MTLVPPAAGPRRPIAAAFFGPDGCGKSTAIAGTLRELEHWGYTACRMHLRPHFGRGEGPRAITNPTRLKPRSAPILVLRQLYWLLDYWTWWLPWRLGFWGPQVLLLDRHPYDLIADPGRYRVRSRPLAAILARLFPKPDISFVLILDPTQLVERKQETTLHEASRQVDGYTKLMRTLPSHIVDAADSPDSVTKSVLEKLGALLDDR